MNEMKLKNINKRWSLLEIYLADDMKDYTGRTCLLCLFDGTNSGIFILTFKGENKRQRTLSVCLTVVNHVCRTWIIFPRLSSLFFMVIHKYLKVLSEESKCPVHPSRLPKPKDPPYFLKSRRGCVGSTLVYWESSATTPETSVFLILCAPG